MAVDVLMPNLGFDTQTGRLLEWLKQPGDAVAKGDAIAVIESDKANVELEALASGVLLEHLAQAEQEVTIGAVIARIGSAADYQPAAPSTPAAIPVTSGSGPRVSPVAQRIARELQVPVEQLAGSGGRGRVTRRDVEAYHKEAAPPPISLNNGTDAHGVKALPRVRKAARERGIDLAAVAAAGFPNPLTLEILDAFSAPSAAPAPSAPTVPDGATLVPLSRMRQTIGRRLSDSMREAPHFYVTGEFVFDAALDKLKSAAGKAKINDLILHLVTQTLSRVPALNATFQDGSLYRHEQIHLAVAVAREDGLITPVLHNAGRFSLPGLAAEVRSLVDRARTNRLSVDDLQGGTFTVSNMGMIAQVEHFTAVINPPQVAILAVGALKPRPVVIDGGLFIRSTAHLTLSGDHRVVDGMDLARFMAVFQEELDRFSA
ncbi:MAG: 2-oxo acid dehydrogenase subunit E2 [Chloroflexi bacterium]|nr:2-oxo acid dehydrogenase subunit E2 [Chloroflexota bacterium]